MTQPSVPLLPFQSRNERDGEARKFAIYKVSKRLLQSKFTIGNSLIILWETPKKNYVVVDEKCLGFSSTKTLFVDDSQPKVRYNIYNCSTSKTARDGYLSSRDINQTSSSQKISN